MFGIHRSKLIQEGVVFQSEGVIYAIGIPNLENPIRHISTISHFQAHHLELILCV